MPIDILSDLPSGRLLHAINKGDRLTRAGMTPQSVFMTVQVLLPVSWGSRRPGPQQCPLRSPRPRHPGRL